jgi:predicted phage terminase large subunit-like protein
VRILSSKQMYGIARSNFASYCALVYPSFKMPPHIEALIQKLEEVESGKIDRLAVSMPPRHGKSVTTSQLFVAWYIGRHPQRNAALASYGSELAQDMGRRVMQTLASPIHQAIFPECKLASDFGGAEHLQTTAGGEFFSVSRAGSLTGRGCSLLVLDDLYKDAQEAGSSAIRKQVEDFYQRTALSRLEPDGAIAMIGTRWHESDLFAHVATVGEKPWTVINYPAIAGANDPLGREEGAALWPQRFSLKHVQAKRLEMGARAFTSLYLGRPAEQSGVIFKREWWQSFSVAPEFKRIILSLDTATKVTSLNDYSALQVWAESQTGFYLLAAWKERVEYPALKRTLISFSELWKPRTILIEDSSSGAVLLQELRSSTSLPIKAVTVSRDKISRAESCTGILEAGRVFLPESAPWLQDYLDELSSFPFSSHDDATDCTTMALNFLRGDRAALGLVAFIRDRAAGFLARIETAVATERQAWVSSPSKNPVPAQPQFKAAHPPLTFHEPMPACPECKAICVSRCSGRLRCNSCGHLWGNIYVAAPVTRAAMLSGAHARRQIWKR